MQPQAKEHPGLMPRSEASGEVTEGSTRRPQKEHSADDTLISDFEPPELGEKTFWLFLATGRGHLLQQPEMKTVDP